MVGIKEIKAARKRREVAPQEVTHSQLLACIINAAGGDIALKAKYVNATPHNIGIKIDFKDEEYVLTLVKLEEVAEVFQPGKKIITL